MALADLPELDLAAQFATADPFDLDWERYPHGLARSDRGLEVLSYDLVGQAYRSPHLRNPTEAKLRAVGLTDGPVRDAIAGMVTSSEGEDHRRMRRAFQPWFVPANVERFRHGIRAVIDDWMVANREGTVDFAAELGEQLPTAVFLQLVGAGQEHADFVVAASRDILKFPSFLPEVRDDVTRAVLATLDWQDDLVERKLRTPGPDLTSALLEAERGGVITREHTHRILFTLITASTESTRAQMACNLWALAGHPEQYDRLRAHPEAVPGATQELYRHTPATLSTSRAFTAPDEFAGIALEAGTPLFLDRFAANNDPGAFTDPRHLDVLRVGARAPFTFGNGRHSCVGRVIAAMEQEELLASAVEHWGRMEVAEVAWEGFPFMQSPARLLLDVAPAR